MRRIEANPPIEQNGNTILIGRNGDEELFRNVSIGYDVTVPETTHVHSVVGSGGQRIRHVRGPVAATAGSGGIRIEDAGGMVEAVAGSGGIVITGAQAAVRARTEVAASTSKGNRLTRGIYTQAQAGSGCRWPTTPRSTSTHERGSGGIRSDQPVGGNGVTSNIVACKERFVAAGRSSSSRPALGGSTSKAADTRCELFPTGGA